MPSEFGWTMDFENLGALDPQVRAKMDYLMEEFNDRGVKVSEYELFLTQINVLRDTETVPSEAVVINFLGNGPAGQPRNSQVMFFVSDLPALAHSLVTVYKKLISERN